jgi:hypothetical protein
MRLKSALEDFETNTLSAVRGLLSKLSYVGRLRDENGTYEHWGLTRVYGDDAAQTAIRASHRVLLFKILKKPLAMLLKDAQASCSQEQVTESEFLASPTLCPPTLVSPAARAHLKAVLGALSALVQTQNDANRQGASQPPPPAPEPRPPADI